MENQVLSDEVKNEEQSLKEDLSNTVSLEDDAELLAEKLLELSDYVASKPNVSINTDISVRKELQSSF